MNVVQLITGLPSKYRALGTTPKRCIWYTIIDNRSTQEYQKLRVTHREFETSWYYMKNRPTDLQ